MFQEKMGVMCVAVWMFLFFLCVTGKSVQAASYKNAISLNGNWIDGNCTAEDNVYFYEFTIPSGGTVMIEGQGLGLSDPGLVVLNKDMTKEYWSNHVYGASVTAPKTINGNIVLEAGTYIVKVYSYYKENNGTGTYRIRGTFTPANNNENEPNNIFSQAQNLSSNQTVTGLISEDDELDFYTFTIKQKQRVKIEIGAYFSIFDYTIWNGDYKCVDEGGWYFGGNDVSPGNREYTEILDAGKYYVKLNKSQANDSKSTGKYTIRYTEITPVTSISLPTSKHMTVGETSTIAATIIPSNASNQNVTWETSNSGVVSVSKTGQLVAKAPGKATITAISEDNKDIKATCTVTVRPKKTSLSKVKNISKKRMKITWKTQQNVSGYQIQYSTNKSYKKAKSKKVSSYYNSVVVSSLKKKTYYVRVRAYKSDGDGTYYGAWSSTKQVKIKK